MRTNATTRNTETRQRRSRFSAAAWLVLAAAALGGCAEEVCVVPDCERPLPPVDVYSVTGDQEVILYWTPTGQEDIERFVVYRSRAAYGTYVEIGHTRHDSFSDGDVRNGRTYYYAVTAVNECGEESDLSREIVHDTPRPEGFGERIYDAASENWRRSGWQFAAFRAVPWDHEDADVYFVTGDDGTPFLVAADMDTDVQDAGFVGFDDVDWAPDGGWSPTGTVEAIPGHMVVVWTRDNHFAKVRVVSVSGGRMEFDWAYQVDLGNPELGPRPPRQSAPQALRPGTGIHCGSRDAGTGRFEERNTRISPRRQAS